MELRLFISPEDVRKFFTGNGFDVKPAEVGRWEKQSHGRDKWITWMEDHVIIDGMAVRASELFEKVVDARLHGLLIPVNVSSKTIIETQFNRILKGN